MNAILITIAAIAMLIALSEWRIHSLKIKTKQLLSLDTTIPLIAHRGVNHITDAIDQLPRDSDIVVKCIDNMLTAAKGINDDGIFDVIITHFIETFDDRIVRSVIRRSQYHKELYLKYESYMNYVEQEVLVKPKFNNHE